MALTDSLISYWKLDEGSGSAIDAHDNNDLGAVNAPGTGTGRINDARDFEAGSSQQFQLADNDDLSVGDIDFTITAWVRFESKVADEMVIVAKADASNGDYFLHYSDGDDRLMFQVFTAAGFASPASVLANNLGSPSTGTWYFVVAWHDASANTLNIQVNNGTVDSTSHSGGVGNFAGTSFNLGGDPFNNFWDGLIDEVGFWKRVLASDERTALYNSGNGLSYDDFGSVGGGLTKKWSIPTSASDGNARRVRVFNGANNTIDDSAASVSAASGVYKFNCTDQGTVVGTKKFVTLDNWDGNTASTSIFGSMGIATVIEE